MRGTRKTIEEKKAELIAGLIAARGSVFDAIKALPERCLDEAFLDVWSATDLLAHLVGWDFTNIEAIQQIRAGQAPSFFKYYDKDWQSYNRELVARHRKGTMEEMLAEAGASHQELIAFLQKIDADTLVNGKGRSPSGRTITIRNLLVSEASDEAEHARQVIAFRERSEAKA